MGIIEGAVAERKYVRIRTVALMYDYDPRELREMCLKGEIPNATKNGKEWRIPVASMEEIMVNGIPRRHRRNNAAKNSRV